ncbi:MAG TPA: 2-dehydropantoate 2-reductase [Actinomycetes bacterium]
MPSIAVLGPGGVGGFVAAALARADVKIVVVAREPAATALTLTGVSVRSAALGNFVAHPGVVAELTEPVDVLLVATKAAGLEAALDRIHTEPRLVVPLLNGVEHLRVLRERFGADRVVAGVIRVESDRPRAGEIVQTSPACRIDIAGARPEVIPLAQTLEDAGIAVRTGDSEPNVMWSKLMRLCPLALTTSASDRPLGFVRSDPRWRSALDNAVAETARVAAAEGATLDGAATMAELESAHAELGSSMRRDIAAGREPELDAIAGAVLRAGARHGIRCPTIEWLAGRVAQRAAIPAPRGASGV